MNLFSETIANFAKQNFSYVDSILEAIDYNASTLTIVATLRYSFARRDQLQYWNSAVQKAYDELTRRGEDAERILKGLL